MLGLAGRASTIARRPATSQSAQRFIRSYATIGKSSTWMDTRGGSRESGYHRYLESIIKQNPHFQIKDAAERWRALTEAERDAYNRRASQFAPSLERGKPIRDLPPPDELTAQGVHLDVLKNTDVTTEGALAVSGANMMAALAAAEQTAIDGRFSHKDMKKALLATSWSKLSDSKISAIYRRAVGYFLFCLEHQNLPALKYKPESLTKSLWMQLSDEKRLEYIERGLKTKLESGVTLWEAAGPGGSWHRWRLLFMSIARDLKMRDYNEWYDVSMKQLENFGVGEIVRRHFRGSHINAIMEMFPEHDWHAWKFNQVSLDYWSKYENRKRYMRWLASLLGISETKPASLEAWYDVTTGQIAALDSGNMIKDFYKGDLRTALKKYYPHHQWLEWKFAAVPRNFWLDIENRRAFFVWLGEQLRVSTMDDWYQVAPTQVRARGGSSVLNKFYRDSLPEALKDVFPTHNWEDHRFKHVPIGYWDSVENQRAYFDWFMGAFGMKTLDQWYSVKATDIPSGRVISKYHYSLYDTLKTLYPYHPWDPTKFGSAQTSGTTTLPPWWKPDDVADALGKKESSAKRPYSRGRVRASDKEPKPISEDLEALKQSLSTILQGLQVPQQLESWYGISKTQVQNIRGFKTLLAPFGGSLPRTLAAAYPEHEWKPWLFLHTPDDFWADKANQVEFLNWVKQEMRFKGIGGFYKVTTQDIKDYGGTGLTKLFNDSVYDIVKSAFPQHDWLPWKFSYIPQSIWQRDPDLVNRFFNYIGAKLKISSMDQWYGVTTNDVEHFGGSGILENLGSLVAALSAVFPSHSWKAWRFSKVVNGFWRQTDNQRQFFEDVREELGIKSLEDWYKITAPQLSQVYGVETLFEQYGGPNALAQALESCYPQHHWESQRFAAQPIVKITTPTSKASAQSTADKFDNADFEDETDNAPFDEEEADDPSALKKQYIKTLGKLLGIKKVSDWRTVTREDLKSAGEIEYLDSEGGLAKILKDVFPDMSFDELEADKVFNPKLPRELLNRKGKKNL